jgi:hypothetical protein
MSKPTSRPRIATATSLALAGALLICLAGCAAAPSAVPPSSSAHSAATPLFASDAEALAAATAAYAKYLEVSDQIARDGGANPERLKPYVSESYLPAVVSGLNRFVVSGLHAAGGSTFSKPHLQSSAGELGIYICNDVSNVKLLSSSGVDVTPPTRADVWPLVVRFEQPVGNGTMLVVSGSETWTGTNFC